MITLLLRVTVLISVSLAVGGTTSKAEPPTISPEVTQITHRFFDAIRQNNAQDYRTVADGVEISYSDSDDNKMSLDRARQEFPDCDLAGITDSQHMSDSAYSFNGTINCVASGKRTQTVGIIADRERVYMVRPGGFELNEKSPAEKAKAETDAQKTLDWLASHPLQVPAGPFKSWSKKGSADLSSDHAEHVHIYLDDGARCLRPASSGRVQRRRVDLGHRRLCRRSHARRLV